jgi:hypothetical protein
MDVFMKRRTLNGTSKKDHASMQVKMLTAASVELVEKELNHWLSLNNVTVQHVGQSQCERNGNLLIVLSVFYKSNNHFQDGIHS